jgi:hypothetical protein
VLGLNFGRGKAFLALSSK